MQKRENIILFFGAILIWFPSFYFDSQTIKFFSLLRTGFLDEFFLGITFASSEIIIFFFLTSLFLWSERKRKWIFPLWVSLFFSVAISFLLKISVQRMRPFQIGITETLPILISESFTTWNYSFPSFQSMLVFCAIPILDKEFPKLKYFWISFAILVAFSRIYFGLHFMSDVIAGGLIGYLIGMIVMKLEKENKFGKNVYEKIMEKPF